MPREDIVFNFHFKKHYQRGCQTKGRVGPNKRFQFNFNFFFPLVSLANINKHEIFYFILIAHEGGWSLCFLYFITLEKIQTKSTLCFPNKHLNCNSLTSMTYTLKKDKPLWWGNLKKSLIRTQSKHDNKKLIIISYTYCMYALKVTQIDLDT